MQGLQQLDNRDEEFPALKGTVYLDHAGTTLASRKHLEAQYRDLLGNIYGNPHSHSPSSQLTTDTIENIRYRVLRYLSASPEDYSIIFTSGCTGALKLVAETFDYHGNCCHNNSTNNLGDEMQMEANHKAEKTRKSGSFSYLLDNHTSVQGMREIAFKKAGKVQCLDCNSNNELVTLTTLQDEGANHTCGNHLFAYPAQSNFSGRKYPLQWITKVSSGQTLFQTTNRSQINTSSPSSDSTHKTQTPGSKVCCCHGNWFTLLDAASLVSTSPLNLTSEKPDFVTLSFYKMFGVPTGLGALVVRNEAIHVLKKTYFGGGTVSVSLPAQRYHVARASASERFEDGTVSFLDIISLRHGFDAIEAFFPGGVKDISSLTFTLAQYFHHQLTSCCHDNGSRLAEVYCEGDFDDINTQGAIVSFNLLRGNGEYVGFSEVDKLAQLHDIHVRTGCFCNIGACQKFLHISDDQIKHNFNAGHVCGDDTDLIDGRPTGAVRVSFGYMSTIEDVQKCLQFIIDCFLETKTKPIFSDIPLKFENNYGNHNNTFKTVNIKSEVSTKLGATNHIEKGDSEKVVLSAYSSQHLCTNNATVSESNAEISSVIKEKCDIEKGTNCDNENREWGNDIVIHKGRQCSNEIFESYKGRQLTDIFLYPVKSCAPFKVKKWQMSSRGLLYDREWMVVTETGIAMSQKREVRLCLLKPSIDLLADTLTLQFPGMDSITIPLQGMDGGESHVNICSSKVCGDRVESIDCGAAVSDWVSEALYRPGCRLIRQMPHDKRASKLIATHTEVEPGRLSLANESQYLLISRDSVAALHEKIRQRQEDGDTQECFDTENLVDRFRGNFVVNGCAPFEEDSWKTVQIRSVLFQNQGTCTRCQMVCMDQHTGERSREPLKTLAVWRGSKVPFGIHLCADLGQVHTKHYPELQVGDPVFVS